MSDLDAAATAIGGLLTADAETEEKPTTQPEQPEAETPEAEQAPAAPESDGSEPAAADETPEEPSSQPRTFTVKVNGQDIEVTEDEVLKGYSRTEDYTRKTMQLAEQRKAFEEQEVAAVRAERQQYATYLDQLKTALTQLTPTEPNWEQLRAEQTPEVFAAELLHWQQTQKRIESVTAEQAKVKAAQEEDAANGFRQYVQQEQAKLVEALPDMKEPEKAKALKASLTEFAQSRGFTPDDLGRVTDHRLILLLHDAMQFHQGKAKAPAITSKIEKSLAVSKPGSRTSPAKTDAVAAARDRLSKSGSVDDAAAAIAAILTR